MDEITIDDFFKVDLRIAKIVEVSEIEEADKSVSYTHLTLPTIQPV